MKKTKKTASKQSMGDFFLNHGEKFVVGLFAALACGLVWGGIDAVRTKPAKPEQRPKVIVEQAERAVKHIAESKGPPAETSKRPSLAKQMEPWREKVVAAPPVAAVFNAPLSDEKVKRASPEVFPLVDLRVHPGWAVIAQPQPAMDMTTTLEQPVEGEKDRKKGKKQGEQAAGGPFAKGKNRMQPPGGSMGPPGMGMGMMPPGMMNPGMTGMPGMPGMGNVARGKIIPYCLVTALVPATRQEQAFMKASSGFQMQSDFPVWSDYRVERAEVDPSAAADAEPKWTRIDFQKVVTSAEEWIGIQPDIAPPDLVLNPAVQLRPMDDNAMQPMPYVLPLPALAGDPWGLESLHPWVVEQLRKRQVEAERFEALMQAEAEKAGRTNILGGPQGGMQGMPPGMGGPPTGAMGRGMGRMPPGMGPGMMPPMGPPGGGSPGSMSDPGLSSGAAPTTGLSDDGRGMGSGMMLPPAGGPPGGPGAMMGGMRGMMGPPGMGGPGMMMGGESGMMGGSGMAMGSGMGTMELPEYRMFRFVDTTVEPGKTYRYRVRVSVRNPNYGIDGQYLTSPELAKPPILPAPWSDASPVAHVPDKHAFLVRALKKGETRKSKTGYEVFVLAENPTTGNYSMRSLVTELGGMVNFDKRQAKGPEAKNAESVTTNGLLVDARGRQEESDGKKGSASGPSEPLELLFLREDGSFSVAAAAESQRDFDRYAPTLPSVDDGRKGGEPEMGGGLFGPSGSGSGFLGSGGPSGGSPSGGSPRGGSPGGRGGPPGR